jgi:hypothetical protein
MSYISDNTCKNIAADLLATVEVQPLSYRQREQRAREIAADEYGLSLNAVQTRYIVKLADLGWHNTVQSTKRSSLDAFI